MEHDSHGFLVEAVRLDATRAREKVFEKQVLPRQRALWDEVAQAADVGAALATLRKGRKLKAMVRGGIPTELRPRVWLYLAGATAKRSTMDDGYYARLLETVDRREADARREAEEQAQHKKAAPSELIEQVEQINKDLGRTFPSHAYISTPEGQAQLRRLLRAYCVGRNPRTGYCQGMNFLAGMLLCVMEHREEDAFWMFVMMIERLLPADYYTDGLTGVRVDSNILLDLLHERLPALHAHCGLSVFYQCCL